VHLEKKKAGIECGGKIHASDTDMKQSPNRTWNPSQTFHWLLVSINISRKSIIPQQGPQEPVWSLSNHKQARWNCPSPIMS